MFKRLLAATLLLAATALPAYGRERVSGWCEQGGNKTTTGGLTSTESVQQSFPSCTITVYDTGTLDISSIFADDAGTVKANPFTASATGFWFWYADDARYDVRLSAGGIVTPFTIGDILLNDTKSNITTIVSVASSATPTFDASLGTIFTNTLTANVTSSTISNPVTGQRIEIYLAQDGVGGFTFAWPANVQLRKGGYFVSDDASAVSTIKLYYDGTNWRETARDPDEEFIGLWNDVRTVDKNGKFATIQAAHDDLGAGGTIFVPEGTYAQGGTTLTISKNNVTLIGAGSGITLITSTAASGDAWVVTGKNSKFVGFTFTGPDSGTAVGMHFHNTVVGTPGRPQMDDVLVEKFGGIGIHLDSTTGPGNLDFCYFRNVRSNNHGSDGWRAVGTDVNSCAFIDTDGSSNDGWGYNIETTGNVFAAAHATSNAAGNDQNFRFEGDQNSGDLWSEGSNAGNLTFTANASDNVFNNLSGLGVGAVVDSGTNNQYRTVRTNPDATSNMRWNAVAISRTGAEALEVVANSPQARFEGNTNTDAGIRLRSRITGVTTPAKTIQTLTNDLVITNNAGSVIFKQEDAGKIILDEVITPHLDITANSPQVQVTGKSAQKAFIKLTTGEGGATTPSKSIGVSVDDYVILNNAGGTIFRLSDVGDGIVRRYKTNGTALVAGDFALDTDWGTTATVDNVVGDDQKFRFRVNSSGTGQAINPDITFTFTDGTWTNAPMAVCNRLGGDQLTVATTMANTTATTVLMIFNGTPVAAETYSFVCIVMGDA